MLLGNNINRAQQSPVVIYPIPVPPKCSTALSLQTTSFDPNYVVVGNRSGQCKVFYMYILNRGIVSDIMPATLRASLVPRPKKGRRKGPGFQGLRMRLIIRNRNTYYGGCK